MKTKQIKVTISRLTEVEINSLDNRIGELWREDLPEDEPWISGEMVTIFNKLAIGYDVAFNEVERLQEEISLYKYSNEKLRNALIAIDANATDERIKSIAFGALDYEEGESE